MAFGAATPGKPLRAMRRVTVTWTSDDTSGAVSGTSTEEYSGLFWGITTDPGATAPTDNYDVCVTDETGLELLGGTAGSTSTNGNGMNRDTTNTEFAQANPYPIPIDGPITLTLTACGNSKVGTIYLWVESR